MSRADRRAKKPSNIKPIAANFWSNAPWAPTGYGTQTKQVVERMQRDGHAVSVSANYGLQAMQTEWNGIPIYPMGYESYSNDTAGAYYRDWSARNPGLPAHLFVLYDAWVLKGPVWDEAPVSIWTMVDHLPVPVEVSKVLAKPNITPIAVTEFGKREIERQGIAAHYIPMAIDTELYKPTPTFQGMTGRELMGNGINEDHFVVTLLNANKGVVPSRKAWGEQLLAASIFLANHDDSRLYIHTERFGNTGGIQLDPLIKAVGLKEHQYSFVNQFANHMGIPNEGVAALLTASDVLLAATMGEGFGLTVLEAQACGTPVIVNNFSAQPELVGDGWLTEGQPWWDPMQFAWFNTPNVPSIVDCLEQAYARGRGRSDAARAHAKKYDADLIWDTHWRPYLAAIADGADAQQLATLSGPQSGEPRPQHWTNGTPNPGVRLTIYVPTYRRSELRLLLASLAPQLDDRVEVFIADNDPEGSAFPAVAAQLSDARCYVNYSRREANIGGEANILAGYTAGHADWVWVVGDDDALLPHAVADVLEAIDHDDVDRLILLSVQAPSKAAGRVGTLAEIAAHDPGLPIASTLISSNVLRRRALDLTAAQEHLGTMYSHSWANTTCHRVRVLNQACIAVGANHPNEFSSEAGFGGDINAVWSDLLAAYGIDPTPESFGWNHVSVQR